MTYVHTIYNQTNVPGFQFFSIALPLIVSHSLCSLANNTYYESECDMGEADLFS